jgi:hypothetical protein
MKNIILRISIIGILVGVLVGVGIAFLIGKEVEVEIEDTFCGIEWGSEKIVVEATLERKGYKNISEGSSAFSMFYAEDYAGISGANGYIVCSYDKKGRVEMIMITFKSESDSDKAPETTKGSLIDTMSEVYVKELKKLSNKTLTHDEYCDKSGEETAPLGDMEMYSLGEKSLITIYGEESERFSIVYESAKSEFAQHFKKVFDEE